MERLTEHWGNNYVATKLDYEFILDMPREHFEHFEAIIKKLAEYEDLEEQGRLITLSVEDIHPCKHCDTGWGSISSEGCTICYDSCERLMQYNERYRT